MQDEIKKRFEELCARPPPSKNRPIHLELTVEINKMLIDKRERLSQNHARCGDHARKILVVLLYRIFEPSLAIVRRRVP
jgi:hypothetical protein